LTDFLNADSIKAFEIQLQNVNVSYEKAAIYFNIAVAEYGKSTNSSYLVLTERF